MEIPQQLKHLQFCRVKKGTKIPFELGWPTKTYSYEEISKFFPQENYGVLCGYHDLAVIDCDKEELKIAVENLLPETFAVKTGGGGTHFYYFIPELKRKIILNAGEEHIGEIQSYGSQVVGAGSLHPNGKEYEVIRNIGIATISLEEMESVLGNFMEKEEILWGGKEGCEDYEDLIAEIVKVWEVGDRQELALSVAGWLRKEKRLGINKVKSIMQKVCEETKDEEPKMRLRAVEETFKKDEKDIKGFTGLGKVDLRKSGREIKIYSDEDLGKMELKPVEWCVEKLISKKSITILAGKRGSFKSLGAIHVAVCISAGVPVFNEYATEGSVVLYVDEENGLDILKERIYKIKKGLGIEKNLPLFFTSFENIKLDLVEWRKKLEEILEKYKPSVVIIDSLRRVITGDENIAGTISQLFTDIIRPLTEKYDLTWIILHHMRKGMGRAPMDEMDEIRGSSDLANYSDNILLFNKPKGTPNTLILKQVKCRRAPEQSAIAVQLVWDDNNLQLSYVGEATDSLYADQMCADMITNWLGEERKTEFTTAEVQEALLNQKQSRASIYRALALLQEQERVRKEKRGHYSINPDFQVKLK